MTGSGVDPGPGPPPETANGAAAWPLPEVGAGAAGAWPDGAVVIGEPARGAEEPGAVSAAPPLSGLALAPGPPALLAAGVDGGRTSGVMAPRVVAFAAAGALDPPRGGKANPPPARAIGCQGALRPDSGSRKPGPA